MIPKSVLDEGPALVFDLWQTLAFDDLPANPFDATIEAFGYDPKVASERRLVEDPLMSRPYRDVDDALDHVEQLLGRRATDRDALRELWRRSSRSARLYDDVLPALDALSGRFRLALLSNTQSFGMEAVSASGVLERFDALVLSYLHGLAKPDPAFFAAAARELGLPPSRLVMIGDSLDRDWLPACAAGFGAALLIDRSGWSERSSRLRRHDPAPAVIRSLDELVAALG